MAIIIKMNHIRNEQLHVTTILTSQPISWAHGLPKFHCNMSGNFGAMLDLWYIYLCVRMCAWWSVCAHCACSACRGQKRASNLWNCSYRLWTTFVGAFSWVQVLCKGNKVLIVSPASCLAFLNTWREAVDPPTSCPLGIKTETGGHSTSTVVAWNRWLGHLYLLHQVRL